MFLKLKYNLDMWLRWMTEFILVLLIFHSIKDKERVSYT